MFIYDIRPCIFLKSVGYIVYFVIQVGKPVELFEQLFLFIGKVLKLVSQVPFLFFLFRLYRKPPAEFLMKPIEQAP